MIESRSTDNWFRHRCLNRCLIDFRCDLAATSHCWESTVLTDLRKAQKSPTPNIFLTCRDGGCRWLCFVGKRLFEAKRKSTKHNHLQPPILKVKSIRRRWLCGPFLSLSCLRVFAISSTLCCYVVGLLLLPGFYFCQHWNSTRRRWRKYQNK